MVRPVLAQRGLQHTAFHRLVLLTFASLKVRCYNLFNAKKNGLKCSSVGFFQNQVPFGSGGSSPLAGTFYPEHGIAKPRHVRGFCISTRYLRAFLAEVVRWTPPVCPRRRRRRVVAAPAECCRGIEAVNDLLEREVVGRGS